MRLFELARIGFILNNFKVVINARSCKTGLGIVRFSLDVFANVVRNFYRIDDTDDNTEKVKDKSLIEIWQEEIALM